MFDTMTMTKVLGGFCGTFLVFMLGKFGAEFIYHEAEHKGDDHHQAYVIDTGEGDEPLEEVAEVPFAEVFAAADTAEGSKLFRQCSACHSLEDGKNGAGPSLYNVVNRAVDSVGGYSYSGNLIAVAEAWTPENLNGFLENPKAYAPGTKMSYKGMPDVEDRANLIAWLEANNS
ncbi:c-type cytochrome [Rhodobacteraceae bacterium]|nr:c-type cytochrome [Paracoccaceae bacterium]